VTPGDESWSHEALSKAQLDDPDIGLIASAFKDGSKPQWETILPCSAATKAYWTLWEQLVLREETLYRRYDRQAGQPEVLQLIVPPAYRPEIIRQAHSDFTGGHLGERRTLEQVRRRAYWVGWAADTRRFHRQCAVCACYKRGKAPQQGPLQSMTVGMPWERVGIDITGPHPKSRNGFVYMLTLVDYFSKWSDAFPIRNQEAGTIAKVLVDRVFAYFGMPIQILTDQGRNFESALFNELCTRLGIDHVRTTAYKPSTNGLVERFHRTLNSILGKVVADNQRDWDLHVPYALTAYRATVHDSTGYSPNFLFLGRENRAPLDLIEGPTPDSSLQTGSIDGYVEHQTREIESSYRSVREQLQRAANRQKRLYDLRVKKAEFKPGDTVWYFYPRRRPGRSAKWQRFYTGPFTVVEQLGPVNYRITKSPRSQPFTTHVDKLKMCLSAITGAQSQPGLAESIRPSSNDQAIDCPDTEDAGEQEEECRSVVSDGDRMSVGESHARPRRTPRLPSRYRDAAQ